MWMSTKGYKIPRDLVQCFDYNMEYSLQGKCSIWSGRNKFVSWEGLSSIYQTQSGIYTHFIFLWSMSSSPSPHFPFLSIPSQQFFYPVWNRPASFYDHLTFFNYDHSEVCGGWRSTGMQKCLRILISMGPKSVNSSHAGLFFFWYEC